MNQINWSAMVAKGATNLKSLLPLEVLYDGELAFVLCNVEDVIVVSDLHIRVRNMLKALEKKARGGMPKAEKITAEKV